MEGVTNPKHQNTDVKEPKNGKFTSARKRSNVQNN